MTAKRKDGYYRFWYNGKQFYDKSREIAKAKRDAYKYECEHGIDRPEQITVFELAEQWLPVAKASCGKGTYNQYVTIMEKMTGIIGQKLVSAVSPADIKKVWASFVGGANEVVVGNIHSGPKIFEPLGDFVDELLRSHFFGGGVLLDFLAVLIGSGQEIRIKTTHPFAADDDIAHGGAISVSQMRGCAGVIDWGCDVELLRHLDGLLATKTKPRL